MSTKYQDVFMNIVVTGVFGLLVKKFIIACLHVIMSLVFIEINTQYYVKVKTRSQFKQILKILETSPKFDYIINTASATPNNNKQICKLIFQSKKFF